MKSLKLNVKLENNSYPIIIGTDILSTLGTELAKIKLKGKVLILSNKKIFKLYGQTVLNSLVSSGFTVIPLIIKEGEKNKNLFTVETIYSQLLKNSFERASTIVALGGGIVGDIAGYAAATYQRGINFVQVPTTLLAQVDSSVGGKTGVNHRLGKNMIGSFYQPKLVLTDVKTLATLPPREMRSGLAEIIKYDLILSKPNYEKLKANLINGLYDNKKQLLLNSELLIKIIATCCQLKAAIVKQDEKEKNIRAILNFGHTFGHAIETATKYKRYTHGEAVALGILAAMHISIMNKYLAEKEYQELYNLYKKCGLPTRLNGAKNIKYLIKLLAHDKKVQNGKIRFILLQKIGQAVIESVDTQLIAEAFYKIIKEK